MGLAPGDRLIARNVGLNKNTILATLKRGAANLEQLGGKVRHAADAPGLAFAVIREFGTLIEVW